MEVAPKHNRLILQQKTKVANLVDMVFGYHGLYGFILLIIDMIYLANFK